VKDYFLPGVVTSGPEVKINFRRKFKIKLLSKVFSQASFKICKAYFLFLLKFVKYVLQIFKSL